MIKFRILNRYTVDVNFTAEIDANEDAPQSLKIALAVKWALKNKADLSGANLSRAYLYGADLSRADLSRAYLYGADLSRADLSRADLSGADLSGADLSGANLSGADLSRANLYGANLSGANLSGAYLYGADLSRAKNIIAFYGFGRERRFVFAWPKEGKTMVQAGCFFGEVSDFRAAVVKNYGEDMGTYAPLITLLEGWTWPAD